MLFAAMLASALTVNDSPDEAIALDSVVVTANRLGVSDNESAVSVEVLSAKKLENAGITKASDIDSLSASVTQRSIFGASAPQFFIRGVGNNDVNPNANPGVAVYLDDTFIASPIGQNLALFDIERAEILKGPQGTLFGRNSTGGTVIFHTRKPTEEFGGNATIGFGTFGLSETQFALNTGRVGSVAARFSGFARDSDGYTDNTLTGGNENDVDGFGGRLLLDFQADGSAWHGLVTLESARHRAGMTAHQGVGLFAPEGFLTPPPVGPVIRPCDLNRIRRNECVNVLGYRYSADPFSEGYDRMDREYVDVDGFSLSLERKGEISFKSISSYRNSERQVAEDTDASPFAIVALDFENESAAFTQEFLIFGGDPSLRWQAGLFGLRETLDTVNRFDTLGALRAQGVPFIPDPSLFFFGPFRLDQAYRQETTSTAAFGQIDWEATDKLSLTAGTRFTSEKNEYQTSTVFREVIAQPILSPLRGGVSTDQAYSWRAAARYEIAAGKNIYASANRAFKSGYFNGGALFPFDSIGPVSPEFILAYELGVKWDFSNILQGQAALFHYNYDGLQDFTLRPSPPPTRQVLDSADADISGAEASLRALLPAGFSLNASVAYLDTQFVDFVDANGVDRSGNRLTASPEWATVAGLDWTHTLNDRFTLSAGTQLDYRSQIFFDNTNSPLLASGSRVLLDARIALADSAWDTVIALSVRNLNDKETLVDVLNIAEYGFLQQTYDPPRRAMLTVTKSF